MLLVPMLPITTRDYQASSRVAGVEWTETWQAIDGFGSSSADLLTSLIPEQADLFFTPADIGFSNLFIQIAPDLATCNNG